MLGIIFNTGEFKLSTSVLRSSWKQWLKPSRFLPLLTILGAGTANLLSLLGILKLTVPESIIIALLALLSVDSLVERIRILEKIEHRLNTVSSNQTLRKRIQMPKPNDQAANASEICVLGVSANYAIPQFRGFYENRIRAGCKVRVILLNPESNSLETWKLLSKSSYTKDHIEATLSVLKELMQKAKVKGKCEVRLSDVLYPFSIFAVNLRAETGSMIVEYYSYDVPSDDRPHIQLTALGDAYWFGYYKQQFESAWSDAKTCSI